MIALLAVLLGCSTPAAPSAVPVDVAKPEAQAAAAIVDFTDAQGQLRCPVMGDVVDKAKATGHQVYQGKDYWFCCEACAEEFAKDPAKYADGKYLAQLDAGAADMDGGHCDQEK